LHRVALVFSAFFTDFDFSIFIFDLQSQFGFCIIAFFHTYNYTLICKIVNAKNENNAIILIYDGISVVYAWSFFGLFCHFLPIFARFFRADFFGTSETLAMTGL